MRKNILLVAILILTDSGTVSAQKVGKPQKVRGLAIAYADEDRLPEAAPELDSFRFFLKPIQEIVKRDFPDVELRIVTRGELVNLPDGTRLNVRSVEPAMGFVLSARGKRRKFLRGVQTDFDFACAAATFYKRRTPACPK